MNKQEILTKYSCRPTIGVQDSIFTVTGITKDPRSSARCFGFYFSKEDAVDAVLRNCGGMDEGGYYQYLVVEEHVTGAYTMPRQEIWFSWRRNKYKEIKMPPKFEQITNFAMG